MWDKWDLIHENVDMFIQQGPAEIFSRIGLFVCLFVCFRLFIVGSGCPSERRLRGRLVVRGNSASIQDETIENSAYSFTCLAYSTVTRDIGLTPHPKDY